MHGVEHNHVTRDIKPPGQCPGCDASRERSDDARKGILNCDFCGNPVRSKDDLMLLPVAHFDIPALQYANYSWAWGACPPCTALIEADDWNGLLNRSCDEHREPGLRLPLSIIYAGLRQHRTGPLRTWSAEDDIEGREF